MITVSEFKKAKKRTIDGKFASPTNAEQIMVDGTWENIECYSGDEPCPVCGDGLVYGADFPNGDPSGACLKCGASLNWNNESGEWEQE